MNFEHPTKIVQFVAAAVAIPVALAGAYTFYQSQISAEGVCDSLRNKLVSVIDRNVPADVKFALLHRDAEQFEKKCAGIDPDTHTVFRVAIAHLQVSIQQENGPAQPGMTQVRKVAAQTAISGSGTSIPHVQPVTIFGLSTSGERRGWVALTRRDSGHQGETNFDGYGDGQTEAPPTGVRLSARRAVPVWLEPQIHGPHDPAMLQGRLGRGTCVEVLATRLGVYRQWAQVAPVACP